MSYFRGDYFSAVAKSNCLIDPLRCGSHLEIISIILGAESSSIIARFNN